MEGYKVKHRSQQYFCGKRGLQETGPGKVVEFQNLVSNNLYATKRARPDTCTAIAFLKTRVRAPNKENWDKFVHLMRYIRGKQKL